MSTEKGSRSVEMSTEATHQEIIAIYILVICRTRNRFT